MKNDPSASKAVSVTTSNSADLTFPSGVYGTKYLYVGVTGDVDVTTASGDDVLLKALAAGVFHPISVKRIKATLTTATNILAVY
jgi:hypothetical protein